MPGSIIAFLALMLFGGSLQLSYDVLGSKLGKSKIEHYTTLRIFFVVKAYICVK